MLRTIRQSMRFMMTGRPYGLCTQFHTTSVQSDHPIQPNPSESKVDLLAQINKDEKNKIYYWKVLTFDKVSPLGQKYAIMRDLHRYSDIKYLNHMTQIQKNLSHQLPILENVVKDHDALSFMDPDDFQYFNNVFNGANNSNGTNIDPYDIKDALLINRLLIDKKYLAFVDSELIKCDNPVVKNYLENKLKIIDKLIEKYGSDPIDILKKDNQIVETIETYVINANNDNNEYGYEEYTIELKKDCIYPPNNEHIYYDAIYIPHGQYKQYIKRGHYFVNENYTQL